MKRFGPGWGWFIQQPMFDGEGGGSGGDGGAGGGTKDADYYKTEAQKAFQARDQLKTKLRELEEQGLVMSPEQKTRLAELEATAAAAEEEKKRKAGEFDAMRTDLLKKHDTEKTTLTTQLSTLQKEIADDKIQAAFGTATDFFGGGEKAKTILTPTLAFKTFREYVSYEEFDFGEDDGGKRKVIVVRDVKNKIIRGDGGHPAPFSEAIARLIESHPEKDHILRGSGKAGSGARGGAGGGTGNSVDYGNLTPAQMRDPAIIAEAKRRTAAAGGIVMGTAWDLPKK